MNIRIVFAITACLGFHLPDHADAAESASAKPPAASTPSPTSTPSPAPAVSPARADATSATESLLWFDPTQLPSFSGTVERYLPNLHGKVDRLMFREGAQIVFPPSAFENVQAVAPAGKPLVVWGIRARTAPIITMLAYAGTAESRPTVLDRFYWRPEPSDGAGNQPLSVSGVVKVPYLTPQGEVAGAVLSDGTIVAMPPGIAAKLKDMLSPDSKMAAEGRGFDGPAGKALVAERVGETPDTLKPLPEPDPAASTHPNR